jgi:Dolichyl-phosphate-mannose-protein mannosyltransferase
MRHTMNGKMKQFLTTSSNSLIAFLLIYFLVTLYFWDGIGPRDAEQYITAALSWRETGAYLGENHWSLRYLLVLPMAFFFTVFEPSEFLASTPNILYGALLVVVTFYYSRRHLGVIAGNIFTLLIATSAFYTIQAAELRIYGVEIFYVVLSLWLFIEGTSSARPNSRILFLAGLMAGGAWLCRESTIFLPFAIGAAAIIMKAPFFRATIPAALGYLTVLIVEFAFYRFAAGNFLYRYKIDLGHGGDTLGTKIGGPVESQSLFDYIAHPFIELVSYPSVSPFVFIGIIALIYLLRGGVFYKTARRIVAIFGLGAVLSFVISGYPLSLEYVEYYPIVCYISLLVTSIAIASLYRRSGKIASGLATVMVVALSFTVADFRDYDEYSEARLLTDLVLAYDEPIFSDNITVNRATSLLRLRGVTDEKAQALLRRGDAIPDGVLVYQAIPRGARYTIASSPTWVEIERSYPRDPSWTKFILRKIIPISVLTPRLSEILQPPKPVILYRTPTVITKTQ